MLPSINGDLAPAMKTQERRERSPNDTVVSQKTTLLSDGTGKWQVSEVRQATTRQDGTGRTTEEGLGPGSGGQAWGNLSYPNEGIRQRSGRKAQHGGNLFHRRPGIDKRRKPAPGGAHNHRPEHQSNRSANHRAPSGEARPRRPGLRFRVSIELRHGAPWLFRSSGHANHSLRDTNGDLQVVSVDTARSDNTHAVQVQIAPSESRSSPPKNRNEFEADSTDGSPIASAAA